MRYLSVCSGIEAASVAWHPLGWEAVGFSEIEAFPSAVLAHHFPAVPNFGDLTRHAQWNLKPGTVDLLVGGTPCQSFSVAGLRAGMADPRGNLALTFLALVDRQRPRWVLWENVPGVLSSNGGRDLGAIIGALEQLGYGWAFRILDAQHFGVPQRRRRLFLVGYLGDWRPPAAVLFEPEGLRGDPPKGAKARQGTARNLERCADGNLQIMNTLCALDDAKWGSNQWVDEGKAIVTPGPIPIQDCRAIEKGQRGLGVGKEGDPSYTLDTMGAVGVGHAPIPFVKAKRAQSSEDDETWEADRPAPTLSVFDSGDTRATVAIVTSTVTSKWATGSGGPAGNECQNLVVGPARSTYSTPAIGHILEDDVASTVTRNTGAGGETQNPAFVVAATYAVRRLTPRECERLQGFPDDWTAIPYRGKPASDGPRYKAIGNSMAVPVMRWIGQRIKAWEDGSL